MKTFFQVLLGLLSACLGFLGSWVALLTWKSWRFPWQMWLAILLLSIAIHACTRSSWSNWLRYPACGYSTGTALLAGMLSYGRLELTSWLAFITLVLIVVSYSTAYGKALKTTSCVWMSVLTVGLSAFAADHSIFHGRLFAWKWRVMEHPVFTPSGFMKIERHGRCAIYATDVGFVDSSYAAVVWGWQVYPRVVFLEKGIPDGELVKASEVQEVVR